MMPDAPRLPLSLVRATSLVALGGLLVVPTADAQQKERKRSRKHDAAPWMHRSAPWQRTTAPALRLTTPGVADFDDALLNPFGIGLADAEMKPALADLDSDGDLDLIYGSAYYGELFYQENTGTADAPAFAPAAGTLGLLGVSSYAAPALADLDGDGDFDLLTGNGLGELIYQENVGDATTPAFAPQQTAPFGILGADGYEMKPAFADIDGDGDFDLFIGHGDGSILLQRNTGTALAPAFAPWETNPAGIVQAGVYAAPSFVDIDGDGDLDLFVGINDGSIVFQENDGTFTDAAFLAPQSNPFNLASGLYYSAAVFHDLDADSDLDALIGRGDGTLGFQRGNSATLPVTLEAFTVQRDGDAARMAWTTTSEDGMIGFDVEHRTDDAWRLVASVPAAGEAASYTYRTDVLGAGTHRFRLAMRDADGGTTYSAVVELAMEVPGQVALGDVYPNPVSRRSTFDVAVAEAQHVDAALYDVRGRRVATLLEAHLAADAPQQVTIEADGLASGLYVLVVEGERFRESRTVVVVR